MTQNLADESHTTTGYAPVNGLDMYYEVHGSGRPLVLLHGAFGTIDTCFGEVLPSLANARQVIAVEFQGHGHTPDIDRPLTCDQLAADTTALLHELGIDGADFFGYSMGGGVALEIATRHTALVGKLVYAGGACYSPDGLYPEILEQQGAGAADGLAGSPWEQAYLRVAPDPEHWPTLIAKVRDMDLAFTGWQPDEVRAITAPTLVIIGDADIVRPEHTVQMFRLLGGGVPGDLVGLPRSQLAILPGTSHVSLLERADWLRAMVVEFLDAPTRRE
jgi:pimeloyl-ACP methyl ester carboxylesterase